MTPEEIGTEVATALHTACRELSAVGEVVVRTLLEMRVNLLATAPHIMAACAAHQDQDEVRRAFEGITPHPRDHA